MEKTNETTTYLEIYMDFSLSDSSEAFTRMMDDNDLLGSRYLSDDYTEINIKPFGILGRPGGSKHLLSHILSYTTPSGSHRTKN